MVHLTVSYGSSIFIENSNGDWILQLNVQLVEFGDLTPTYHRLN